MSAPVRVRPFPTDRLSRLDRAALALAASGGSFAWRAQVTEVASAIARRFGLGAAEIQPKSVQSLRMEELRVAFPGQWRFAAFADPVAQRNGFLAVDPMLLGRVASRLDPGRIALPGWIGSICGETGLLAWLMCSGLEALCSRDERIGGWRFLGMAESVGEVGRACAREDFLVGTWLRLEAGWEKGFAVWLEPESSVRRRPERSAGLDDEAGEWLAAVVLPIPLVAGESELLWEEIQGLSAGDVVLLDGIGGSGFPYLRLGALIMRGKLAGRQFRIATIAVDPGGGTMSSCEVIPDGKGAGLSPEDLGKLPVPLVAQTGCVDLTVGQLSALKAGDVLTFPEAVLGPVELRAGGRLLARGELVDVEGRRGVRILELAWLGGEHENADGKT